MSTLYMKQKMLTLGEKFTVLSESQEPRYFVEGSFMRIPKRFTITALDGRLVAEITKEVFTFQPCFTVEMDGSEVATIRKQFSFFKPRYSVEGAGITITGDWWDMNFSVQHDEGGEIAAVRRKALSWADTYELEVHDETFEAMVVSIVVAIDRVRADEDNASFSSSI